MPSINTLLNRFNKLPEEEQQILIALSMVFIPIGQTRFQNLLRQLECIEPLVYKKIAKPLREKLLASELLEETNAGLRVTTGGLSEKLMRIGVKKYPDMFVKLAKWGIADQEYVPYQYQIIALGAKLRFFLYLGLDDAFIAQFEQVESVHPKHIERILSLLFFADFDAEWFASIHVNIRTFVLTRSIEANFFELKQTDFVLQLLQQTIASGAADSAILLAEYNTLLGHTEGVEQLIQQDDSVQALCIKGSLCFIENRNDQALDFYHAAIAKIKKETRKRNIILPNLHAYLFCLA
ncbi:MAG: hypothetical protein GQ582_06220, partial [Methyloprofundus sp.]|nr:hypothetical protein [Methyloprofundus sp.]